MDAFRQIPGFFCISRSTKVTANRRARSRYLLKPPWFVLEYCGLCGAGPAQPTEASHLLPSPMKRVRHLSSTAPRWSKEMPVSTIASRTQSSAGSEHCRGDIGARGADLNVVRLRDADCVLTVRGTGSHPPALAVASRGRPPPRVPRSAAGQAL